jgi:hypothetical protein
MLLPCPALQGCIVTRPVEDHAVVEVSFHNTQRMTSGRVPNVTDFYGFTLGALGAKGAALACPPSADVQHSMVFYRCVWCYLQRC